MKLNRSEEKIVKKNEKNKRMKKNRREQKRVKKNDKE